MHFKKILSIFLAAVLTLSMLTVFAVGTEETEIFQVEVEAETTASTLSASPLLYRPGEEIKVTLRASQNTGVTSVMLYVDYDETVLEVSEAGCKATGLLTEADELTHGVRSDGDAYFTFYSDNYPNVSTATGTIAEITFIAKEVCTVDSVLSVSLFQNNEELCTVQTESGAEIVPFVGVSESFSVHDISADSGIVTEPACTEGGYTTYVCQGCGEDVVGNFTEATGHTPGEAVEENRVEPTCTEKGSYDSVVYCEVCGEEVSREPFEIDALGHVLVQVAAKAPTCTESGWNAYESCQREGCGYSTYQELPASGHKFGETTVYEPEYNKEGYSVHTCTVCGYEERFNIVPPLPYLAGDVNGDGRLTGADYLILKRAILKIAPLPDEFAAAGDFNGDGEMTATDYLLLKRQILFGE